MNILRVGSRIISRSNPVLLIATGAAIALSLPPVRKGLRSAALFATRSLIKAKEGAQSLGSRLQEEAEDIIAEAKLNCDSSRSDCEMIESMSDSARENGRELAETAAAGYLAVKDKAVELGNEFTDTRNTELELRELEGSDDELSEHQDPTLENEQVSLEKEHHSRRRHAIKEHQ